MARKSRQKKADKEQMLFNPLKRRVFRKRIPLVESLFGVMFLLTVVFITYWVAQQQNNYDPGERDITFAALQQSSVEDNLYRRPLKVWRDPRMINEAGAGASGADLGKFPKTLLDGGWQIDGRVEQYDPENLYVKINGAAEQYLNFGFVELNYVTLSQAGRYLTVELYDQDTFANAMGIFAAQRDPEVDVNRSGGAFYYPTSVGAIGIANQYFFKITGSEGGVQIANKSQQLVGMLSLMGGDEKTQASQLPRGFDIFANNLDIDFANISYQKNNVFQYDFAGDFWFASIEGQEEGRYYIHQASDKAAAKMLFNQLKKEQSYEYKLEDESSDYLIFVHQYLDTYFTIQQNESIVYGIEGLANYEAIEQLMDELNEGLAGE